MRFSSKWVGGLQAIVLLMAGISLADSTERDSSQVTVLVINSARVAPAILRQAERESARIFLSAGIEILWVNCGPDSPEAGCPEVGGVNQFVLHIVPQATTFTDSVFGVAFLGENGRGRYGDVFFDGIAAMKEQPPGGDSQLLGAVMTHELGHLLLGAHSHSPVGIMMPVWNPDGLRRIRMGNLFFTSEESSRIRARIRTEQFGDETSEPSIASRREPYLVFLGGLP